MCVIVNQIFFNKNSTRNILFIVFFVLTLHSELIKRETFLKNEIQKFSKKENFPNYPVQEN